MQKLEGSLPREPSRIGIVVGTLVAVEAVPGWVGVDLRTGECLAVPFNVGGRNDRVALTEMQQQGRSRFFAEKWHGSTTVIAHCRQAEPRVGQEGHAAAPAEADHGDGAGGSNGFGGRANGGDGAIESQFGSQGASSRDTGLVVIQLHAGFQMIENRRCDRLEAFGGEARADRTDVRIHPEDLLDNDHTAQDVAVGSRPPGTDAVHAGSRNLDE